MLEHGNMMLRHSASAQDGPKHEANHSSGRSASCLCCRHEDGKQQHAKVRCGVGASWSSQAWDGMQPAAVGEGVRQTSCSAHPSKL